jgi:hypothetical protein
MSTSGGVWKALERGIGIGCDVVQIFVKNNMQWFGKAPLPDHVGQFKRKLAAGKFTCVFGHAGARSICAGRSPRRQCSRIGVKTPLRLEIGERL